MLRKRVDVLTQLQVTRWVVLENKNSDSCVRWLSSCARAACCSRCAVASRAGLLGGAKVDRRAVSLGLPTLDRPPAVYRFQRSCVYGGATWTRSA
jgi:hypothetical protein